MILIDHSWLRLGKQITGLFAVPSFLHYEFSLSSDEVILCLYHPQSILSSLFLSLWAMFLFYHFLVPPGIFI